MFSSLGGVKVLPQTLQQLPMPHPQPIEDLFTAGLRFQIHIRGQMRVQEGQEGRPAGLWDAQLGVDADPVEVYPAPSIELAHYLGELFFQLAWIGDG
jgi:hypothetical protein